MLDQISIGQLAKSSGVSLRTLRHYDDIGVLKPAYIGANGYRYYGRTEQLRLQEILFYKAIGLSLRDIQQLLQDGKPMLDRLLQHRQRLTEQAETLEKMRDALDLTILELSKGQIMTQDLYAPFSDAQQTEYENWLVQRYGSQMAEAVAQAKVKPDDLPEHLAELKTIEEALVGHFHAGVSPDGAQVMDTLAEHHSWVEKSWHRSCSAQAYQGLAELYQAHPDFIARYETLAPQFSDWLPNAMRNYAKTL